MEGLSFIISIIALVCAYAAYKKSGGSTDELKRKVEDLNLSTESLRRKMGDILLSFEKKVRGEEKKSGVHPDTKGSSQQDTEG